MCVWRRGVDAGQHLFFFDIFSLKVIFHSDKMCVWIPLFPQFSTLKVNNFFTFREHAYEDEGVPFLWQADEA